MDKLINESIFLSSDSLKFVQTGGDWNGFFFWRVGTGRPGEWNRIGMMKTAEF